MDVNILEKSETDLTVPKRLRQLSRMDLYLMDSLTLGMINHLIKSITEGIIKTFDFLNNCFNQQGAYTKGDLQSECSHKKT